MPGPSGEPLAKLFELCELYDPRRVREQWLAEVRKLTAEVLRSPPFLAFAKFNLSLLGRRSTPP
jgi:hypothetical protein